MKQIKVFAICMLLLSQYTFAQESEVQTYNFSLEDAINYALKNSSAAINADRDVKIAKKKKWETTADGLPQIDGSINYMNNINRGGAKW